MRCVRTVGEDGRPLATLRAIGYAGLQLTPVSLISIHLDTQTDGHIRIILQLTERR